MFISTIKVLKQLAPINFINYEITVVNNGKNLTLNKDYLIDLFNKFYTRYLLYTDESNKDIKVELSSLILKKMYGEYYTIYVNYLYDNHYIKKVKNHYKGKNCNVYALNSGMIDFYEIKEYTNKNYKLIRYYNKLLNSFQNKSAIYTKQLITTIKSNLNHVHIDGLKALNFLSNEYKDHQNFKYLKNFHSIRQIHDANIYLIQDKYGRIHTNFTVLKKEIKKQFIFIDREKIQEKDIINSQALFFLLLLSQNLSSLINPSELNKFKTEIISGKFYNTLAYQSNIPREEFKKKFFKYLFGPGKKPLKIFNKQFPTISKFIKDYKVEIKDYRKLSHNLQKLESNFIFNCVCKKLIHKKIVFFTVHDSICVAESKFQVLTEIFENELAILKQQITENINVILNKKQSDI